MIALGFRRTISLLLLTLLATRLLARSLSLASATPQFNSSLVLDEQFLDVIVTAPSKGDGTASVYIPFRLSEGVQYVPTGTTEVCILLYSAAATTILANNCWKSNEHRSFQINHMAPGKYSISLMLRDAGNKEMIGEETAIRVVVLPAVTHETKHPASEFM